MTARNAPRAGRWSPREPWTVCLARFVGMVLVGVSIGWGIYGIGLIFTWGHR